VPSRAEVIGTFYPHLGSRRGDDLPPPHRPARAGPRERRLARCDEDLRVATFDLDTVRAMIRSSEIVDGKTVLGLSLLA